MPDVYVDDIVDALPLGKTLLKTGKFPEAPVTLPGLDPTDRNWSVSDGCLQFFAPGLKAGQTAEWRESLATFDSNRDVTTLNSCIFRGWNYAAGGQINAAYGTIGSGEEFAYQPTGNNETWSEIHPARFIPPGGLEKRLISGYGDWATGRTGILVSGSEGSIRYQPTVGASIDLIYWGSSSSMNVQGNGFYFPQSGNRYLQQLNANANGFLSLPYAGSGDEIFVGYDPHLQNIPPLCARDIHLIPVAAANVITPTSGVKLFWDSATDSLSAKTTAGTVLRYSGSRRL
jgi:hypothetical protein